jgi:predicted transposase/invertase (TIGR01784 family)
MLTTNEKYVNLFTDFGFKKIFGSEFSKDLLISFLNSVIPNLNIIDLSYKQTENLGKTDLDRKVIFDLYCENTNGEKFIVELQKTKQSFFKDRTLFYSTFPIQEQGQKGDWNYELKAVFTVAVLDFCFEDKDKNEIKVTAKLMDIEEKTIFYDKLTFIYLQMPNFNKSENELITEEDKWYFVLKNLHKLDRVPDTLRGEIFAKLFENAEIAKFTPEERTKYEDSLKYYRDIKNSLDTAKAEGKLEEKIDIAKNLISKGFQDDVISEITGLTLSQIQELKKA